MPEADLCRNGKIPKILSYIDQETQQYVGLTLQLKEEISEFELKKFFNQLYHIKLDYSYSNTFSNNYSTRNLIVCLKNILKENRVINLKELSELLNKGNLEEGCTFDLVMQAFFQMFEITNKEVYSLTEYNEMVKQNSINPLFKDQDSNFKREIQAILFNSYILNGEYKKQGRPKVKVKETQRIAQVS